jgi:hypothetical protein
MTSQHRVGRQPKKAVKGRSGMNFRINASLRRELVEAAAAANRSIAAEIEHLIAFGLAAEKTLGDLKEYQRKVERGINVKYGLEPSPGGFIPTEEAEEFLQGKRDHLIPSKFTEAERVEIQRMVDDAMRKSVAELIKKDDAA